VPPIYRLAVLLSPDPRELDGEIAVIVDQQRTPDRNIAYLGCETPDVAAELDGLEPPWTTTVRVARADGRIVGVVAVEWDETVGRSWVMGPWVVHDGSHWLTLARDLLDAALAQVPPGITRHEMCGDVANLHLAELARSCGWWTTEVNHALAVDEAVVASWPDVDVGSLRPAAPGDLEGIRALHDAEFPATYATADQLVSGQQDSSRVTLVAPEGAGGVAGYASGHLQDDGEACLDFVVVHPDHHGTGLGRRLVAAIGHELLPRSPQRRMSLTVQDQRAPARHMYERLGFRQERSIVGYRSWAQ
jgi:GNAT superfamily N-acetyltransferase